MNALDLTKPHDFTGDRRFCRGCGMRQAVARGECVANANRPPARPAPTEPPTAQASGGMAVA